jgi:hypothetical protein
MKESKKLAPKSPTPEQQIKGFIARFEPRQQALIRALRKSMRKRFPSANELIYDYSLYFVVGYSPTDRGIDSVFSIAAGEDGVRFYFNQGQRLPDPKKILLGSGKQTRFIRIESPRTLKRPEVEALVQATLDRAKKPFATRGSGALIIKSSAEKRQAKPKKKR